MGTNINCRKNDNTIWCNDGRVKRSLSGMGARICSVYRGKECQFQDMYPPPNRSSTATAEVIEWAQAVLTALNVGYVQSGSKLHLKLREAIIAYRASISDATDAFWKTNLSDDAPPASSNTTPVDEAAFTNTLLGCRKAKMEELQKVLVTKISEQLQADEINIQLLDSLNRLLGTVAGIIYSSKELAMKK